MMDTGFVFLRRKMSILKKRTYILTIIFRRLP